MNSLDSDTEIRTLRGNLMDEKARREQLMSEQQ
jgi:hypothetical protein